MKNQMLLYFFATMLLTLVFTALITRVLIPKLRSIKMGQKILDIGPRWHKSKEGTPTMGGIAFIIASVFTTAITAVLRHTMGSLIHSERLRA